jgi:hypothetical protein
MIDILLNLPDRRALAGLGPESTILPDDDAHTPPCFADGVNIHGTGAHRYLAGGEVADRAPGWRVMFRADDGRAIPEAIFPHVTKPEPTNPAIPNRVRA